MIILNFDTALDKTYIALSKDNEILSSKIITNTEDNYHSAFLISAIKDILKENHLTPKDINLLGVNIGPGSFTGIRASLTVAKVMAQELNIKIVPVESLKILSKLNTTNKESLILLDARRNTVYAYINNTTKAISTDEAKSIISNDYFIITDKSMSKILNIDNAYIYEENENDLGKILNILTNEEKDNAILPGELKALYIQTPPVFVNK